MGSSSSESRRNIHSYISVSNMSVAMSSSSSFSTSKKICVKNHLGWEALRTEIFRFILYSTNPAEFDAQLAKVGIGAQISSIVQLYLLDLSKIPIPMLKAFLERIAKKKNSYEWISFIYKTGIKEAVPCSLPCYKKHAGAMIRVDEGGLERVNVWSMQVSFGVKPTQKKWKRSQQFVVSFTKKYRMVHETGKLPTSKLDTYAFPPELDFQMVRDGCLADLMTDEKFLHHLRYLILKGLYRLKRTKFCQKPASKNLGKKKYEVLCGARVPDGCNCCRGCFQKTFSSFLVNF